MWGCDYGVLGGRWGGFFPGGPWSLLILLLVFLLLFFLIGRLFRNKPPLDPDPSRDRIDSEAILRSRFARGEISESEYRKMKEILAQP